MSYRLINSTGTSADTVSIILLDGENISFVASLVMYINSTNIPAIIIMNTLYEKSKSSVYCSSDETYYCCLYL